MEIRTPEFTPAGGATKEGRRGGEVGRRGGCEREREREGRYYRGRFGAKLN